MRQPTYFKFILAVTFANKAAQEMKDRVIEYLGGFADGSLKDAELQEQLGLDEAEFQKASRDVLSSIIHQYSQFAISTIDAFFQKVIRSFTRESGLLGNFRLEAENDLVLDEVIAMLMDELGESNPVLTDWVIQFSRKRLLEGQSWNITGALKGFSKETLKDSFKTIGDEIQRVQQTISFPDYARILRNEMDVFLSFMKDRAQRALHILQVNAITKEDFNFKDAGTAYRYFRDFAHGVVLRPGKRVIEAGEDPKSWAVRKSPRAGALTKLAEEQLLPILREMLDFDDANFIRFNSARLVHENFYSYGLISDITRKLRDYKAENNLMLLSDASHFLNGVISDSDTPFIYEKVGSFYRHYLMDEFQDTSGLQWKNFQPLVKDSLDQNYMSLVVGDVKQSIYRWRGSDLGLLQREAERDVGAVRTETHILGENWRSADNLVRFNNALFTVASQRVADATGDSLPTDAFKGLEQRSVRHTGQGFISIQFIDRWFSRDEDSGMTQALEKVPVILEELQSKGVSLGDIAILVRRNEEGHMIANHLLRHKISADAKPGFRYDVVSNESLRLDAASSVLLLVSALKYLNNPYDSIARGQLVYEYASRRRPGPEEFEKQFAQAGENKLKDLLPDEFVRQTTWLVKLPLFELTETLIRLFQLGDDSRELSYLQSFQDQVLEFLTLEKNDVGSFLEWWEEMKSKKSITLAAHADAAGIFTIHKAKGMQFKYVIIPFCSWRMDPEIPPLIWCKSDQPPFDKLGHVAVRYSKDLKQSFFAEDYDTEFTRTYLDNLNLLYVACTRAEEGMFILAPLPKTREGEEENKISNVGQLLCESILHSDELKPHFNVLTTSVTIGELKLLSTAESARSFRPVELGRYVANDWRKKLVIKREGHEFFSEQSDQRKRINYGMLMHRVLSHVHYKEDLESAIKKMNLEGVIMEEEAGLIKAKIEAMFAHAQVGVWFRKEWHVLTEVPVIIPGGSQDRLDRVIYKAIKNSDTYKAIIIDYKTGERRGEDRKQVEMYSQALLQMGYVDVEGFLLYLDKLEVVPVVSKTNLNLEF